MDKGWREITTGADIRVPNVYKFIIKYITPLLLGFVLFKSLPDVWDKITNKAIYAEIATTTDPAMLDFLNNKILFVNGSRLLLVAVFVGISYLVYVAYKKRLKENRI
jgi:hypothetical protein